MSHELPSSLDANLQAQHAEVEVAFIQEGIDAGSKANLSVWVKENTTGEVTRTLSEMK